MKSTRSYVLDISLCSVPSPAIAPLEVGVGPASANVHGSLKKRVAPPPPAALIGGAGANLVPSHYGTLPSSSGTGTASHSRTTSEPILAGHALHTLPTSLITLNTQHHLHHKRSPSGDSSSSSAAVHGTRNLSTSFIK